MDVIILADQGTHLLIGCGDRFAIIERRNNRLYNCHAGTREGIPREDISGAILDESDWTDKTAAQAAFNDIVARGTKLSQTML